MGSPSFGLLPGNNAPPPIPGNTNPTGTNKGVSYTGTNFPNYPMFGTPSSPSGVVSPSANMPVFGNTGGGVQNLSTGLYDQLTAQTNQGNPGDHLYKELVKAYGKGMGVSLFDMLIGGLYNPQTANAFLNQMQPGVNRGQANLLNAFSGEGSRFGSAAQLGLGDYLSQVNLNEQQTLSNMYMQAQNEQLQLMTGLLPTLHGEQANSGGWLHDLVGGLEIAGGVASMFVPGLQPLGAGLIAGGAGQLATGIAGNGNGGSGFSGQISPFMIPGTGGNTGTFGSNAPNMDQFVNDWIKNEQDQSAARELGGYDPAGNNAFTNAGKNDPGMIPFFQ